MIAQSQRPNPRNLGQNPSPRPSKACGTGKGPATNVKGPPAKRKVEDRPEPLGDVSDAALEVG